ncbi:MAG: glycosyltransferase family 4 protein [Candidatus Rokubacteria bacterium]|nr:glycosyltransferase family 4 protein [Candidatus Rokubacteria bacterium]
MKGARRVGLTLGVAEPGGGSRSFARVLADWLPRYGFEVASDPAEPCDVLLVFAHFADYRTLKRQKARGVKLVHRIDERLEPNESRARRKKHAFIAKLNTLVDVTVFQSRFAQDNMSPILSCPRSRVIHNGVDPALFSADGPAPPLEGRPRALHVSWSVGESKRLDRIGGLLDALPREARVYLVGRQAEADLPFLADPRVRVLGVKSREEVASLMRGSDFLFFPSEFDPCPNTVIEAMACGLPVLYHPSGGTVELVGDAGVPFSGSLETDVNRLLTERPALSARGLARAQEFSAERVAARYAEVMRDLLEDA